MAAADAVPQNPVPDDPMIACFNEVLQKIEHGGEEMAQLVPAMKRWQDTRCYQQEIMSTQSLTAEQMAQTVSYVNEIGTWLANLYQKFVTLTSEVPKHFAQAMLLLHEENARLEEELVKWKTEQRRFLIGGPADTLNDNLKHLKLRFENLENHALSVLRQIDRYVLVVETFNKTDGQCQHFLATCRGIVEECGQFHHEINSYTGATLVQKGFIVYEQPPPVVRRNDKASRCSKVSKIPFNMEARMLVGEMSGLLRENLQMEALLISEKTARDIVEGRINPTQEITRAGNIEHPVCNLAPSINADHYMSAKFTNARVLTVEKEAEDDAAKKMYHILFRAKQKRTANGTFSYYPFWTISLPFSVVVNASKQEKYKRALMFWHTAFLIDDKTSLSKQLVDDKQVPWQDFSEALNLWFKSFSKIMRAAQPITLERGLDHHMEYIKEKIGCQNGVMWDMFYKGKAPTFWDWIYPIADYVSKNSACWENGMLLGFASRNTVQQILSASMEPAIVLKFSDSRVGKMVASYVNWIDVPQKIIEHVIFDEDEDKVFVGKSLVDCIRMSPKLKHTAIVLPINKPISELFELENALPTKKPKPSNQADGYVRPGLVFVWGDPPEPPHFQNELPALYNQNAFAGGFQAIQQGAAAQIGPYANQGNLVNMGAEVGSNSPTQNQWANLQSVENSLPSANSYHMFSDSPGSDFTSSVSPYNYQQSPQDQQSSAGFPVDPVLEYQSLTPGQYYQEVETMVNDMSLHRQPHQLNQ